MKKLKNNAGASMVEVMIYMVIGVIVIGYALNSMGTISTGYVRGRTVMKMQKDGRDAVQAMARDIAGIGNKFYVDAFTASVTHDFDVNTVPVTQYITYYITRPSPTQQDYVSDYTTTTHTRSSMGLPDDRNWLFATYCGNLNVANAEVNDPDFSASFIHSDGEPYDTLTFYQMRMTDPQTPQDIVRIRYYVTVTNGVGTLWRDEVTADTAGLNAAVVGTPPNPPTIAQWAIARSAIWDGAPVESIAILDNVAALQFLYSPDGFTWDDVPTDERHLQKMVKIELLVQSHRDVDGAVSPDQTLAEGTAGEFVIRSGTGLYRLYEKIVEIPNNGIIAIPTP